MEIEKVFDASIPIASRIRILEKYKGDEEAIAYIKSNLDNIQPLFSALWQEDKESYLEENYDISFAEMMPHLNNKAKAAVFGYIAFNDMQRNNYSKISSVLKVVPNAFDLYFAEIGDIAALQLLVTIGTNNIDLFKKIISVSENETIIDDVYNGIGGLLQSGQIDIDKNKLISLKKFMEKNYSIEVAKEPEKKPEVKPVKKSYSEAELDAITSVAKMSMKMAIKQWEMTETVLDPTPDFLAEVFGMFIYQMKYATEENQFPSRLKTPEFFEAIRQNLVKAGYDIHEGVVENSGLEPIGAPLSPGEKSPDEEVPTEEKQQEDLLTELKLSKDEMLDELVALQKKEREEGLTEEEREQYEYWKQQIKKARLRMKKLSQTPPNEEDEVLPLAKPEDDVLQLIETPDELEAVNPPVTKVPIKKTRKPKKPKQPNIVSELKKLYDESVPVSERRAVLAKLKELDPSVVSGYIRSNISNIQTLLRFIREEFGEKEIINILDRYKISFDEVFHHLSENGKEALLTISIMAALDYGQSSAIKSLLEIAPNILNTMLSKGGEEQSYALSMLIHIGFADQKLFEQILSKTNVSICELYSVANNYNNYNNAPEFKRFISDIIFKKDINDLDKCFNFDKNKMIPFMLDMVETNVKLFKKIMSTTKTVTMAEILAVARDSHKDSIVSIINSLSQLEKIGSVERFDAYVSGGEVGGKKIEGGQRQFAIDTLIDASVVDIDAFTNIAKESKSVSLGEIYENIILAKREDGSSARSRFANAEKAVVNIVSNEPEKFNSQTEKMYQKGMAMMLAISVADINYDAFMKIYNNMDKTKMNDMDLYAAANVPSAGGRDTESRAKIREMAKTSALKNERVFDESIVGVNKMAALEMLFDIAGKNFDDFKKIMDSAKVLTKDDILSAIMNKRSNRLSLNISGDALAAVYQYAGGDEVANAMSEGNAYTVDVEFGRAMGRKPGETKEYLTIPEYTDVIPKLVEVLNGVIENTVVKGIGADIARELETNGKVSREKVYDLLAPYSKGGIRTTKPNVSEEELRMKNIVKQELSTEYTTMDQLKSLRDKWAATAKKDSVRPVEKSTKYKPFAYRTEYVYGRTGVIVSDRQFAITLNYDTKEGDKQLAYPVPLVTTDGEILSRNNSPYHKKDSICHARVSPIKIGDKKIWIIEEMQSDLWKDTRKRSRSGLPEKVRKMFEDWPRVLMNEVLQNAISSGVSEVWMSMVADQTHKWHKGNENYESSRSRFITPWKNYYDDTAKVFDSANKDTGILFTLDKATQYAYGHTVNRFNVIDVENSIPKLKKLIASRCTVVITKEKKTASRIVYGFKFDPNSTKNQGRLRLRDPKEFKNMWTEYEWKDIKAKGVSYIVGVTKENKKAVQAIRFAKSTWTESEAGKWWDMNKISFKKTWADEDWKILEKKAVIEKEKCDMLFKAQYNGPEGKGGIIKNPISDVESDPNLHGTDPLKTTDIYNQQNQAKKPVSPAAKPLQAPQPKMGVPQVQPGQSQQKVAMDGGMGGDSTWAPGWTAERGKKMLKKKHKTMPPKKAELVLNRAIHRLIRIAQVTAPSTPVPTGVPITLSTPGIAPGAPICVRHNVPLVKSEKGGLVCPIEESTAAPPTSNIQEPATQGREATPEIPGTTQPEVPGTK